MSPPDVPVRVLDRAVNQLAISLDLSRYGPILEKVAQYFIHSLSDANKKENGGPARDNGQGPFLEKSLHPRQNDGLHPHARNEPR